MILSQDRSESVPPEARSVLRRPRLATDGVLDVVVWWCAALAPAAAGLVAAWFWLSADVWWPATVLLYGPRWALLLPVAAIGVLAAVRQRWLLLPVVVSALVLGGPVLGFCSGWRTLAAERSPERELTIVTLNVSGGESLRADIADLMNEWDADVAAFQECGSLRWEVLELSGWHTMGRSMACIVSRFPIVEARVMERRDIEEAGGTGLAVAYRLAAPDESFWLTNIHLTTPRSGLVAVATGRLTEGADLVRRNSLMRTAELRRVRRFASDIGGPHVVVGDFNTPVESRSYRREWADWTNAFSFAGFGIGATSPGGASRSRIDHVVVDASWLVVDARTGEDVGSDHLPVIATIRRR